MHQLLHFTTLTLQEDSNKTATLTATDDDNDTLTFSVVAQATTRNTKPREQTEALATLQTTTLMVVTLLPTK